MYQVKPMVHLPHCCFACQRPLGIFISPEHRQETTNCRKRTFLNLKCCEFLDAVSQRPIEKQ